MSTLEAALDYARRGWYVLPLHTPLPSGGCDCPEGTRCDSVGKHPWYHASHFPHGARSASVDEETIRGWWARWPDANVGIATGAKSGLMVIDIDPRYRGDQTWAGILAGHSLPDTPTANTGGGGWHLLFAHPGGKVKDGAHRLGPGVDVKGDGGLIVAAPSLHASGKRYAWAASLNGNPPATLPDWLARNILPEAEHDAPPAEAERNISPMGENILPEAEHRADPWQAYTLADAYAPRPPLAYIVGGLFTLPSLNMIYGDVGSMKSMLLADLCVCVAAGLDWLTPLPNQPGAGMATIRAPVMWVDFDNGIRRMHERFEALARARNLPPDLPITYYSMPSPWLDAGDSGAMADLAGRMMARGVKLLALDNLGLVSGDADENSADMTRVMGGFRWLSEATGAVIVPIHHERKASGFGKASDSLRGHSSIKAALDAALLVEREPYADSVTIRATKMRDGEIMPFGAQFAYDHKPGTRELAGARFYGVALEDTYSDRAIETAILGAVGEHRPINKSALTEKVKALLSDVGINRIRAVIDRMAAAGKLTTTSGTRGARQYDLPR